MSITIELEPENDARLNEQAKREGREPAQVAARFIQNRCRSGRGFPADASDKSKADAVYEAAIASMRNRTREQIADAQARLLAVSRRAKPLPPGKTLEDMVYGK